LKIKKILISQPKPETGKSPYFEIAEKYNIKIDFRPFIKVDAVSAKEFRQQHIEIQNYSAFIFTSRTGVDHFFHLCKEMRVPINEEMRYFCQSETIAFYLQKYVQFRKRKVFYGATGKLSALGTVLNKHNKEKFLAILPDGNNDEVLAMLNKCRITFDEALMYRIVSNDFEEGEDFNYDMLIFFSPQGIPALLKNFPDFKQDDIYIGALGASASNAVKEAGLRLDLEVPNMQFSSMALALDEFVRVNHKNEKNSCASAAK
jgi:uroporphyrinogen-III synthase